MESGTWAEWVGGIGTVLAFALTGTALLAERRRARRLEEGVQASRIFAAVHEVEAAHEIKPQAAERVVEIEYLLALVNASDLPILDVVVRTMVDKELRLQLKDLEPLLKVNLHIVMPESIHRTTWPVRLAVPHLNRRLLADHRPWVELDFTDSAGRRWRRNRFRQLYRLPNKS